MFRKAVLSLVLVAAVAGAVRSEELVVGTYAEFPPFETLDESGEVHGFDIDVINAIGREMGFTPKWFAQAFLALIEGLQTGRSSIVASGLTITDARREKVDFTDPYFDVGLVAVVREGDPVPTSIEELRDKRLSILMASTASVVVEKAFGQTPPNVRFLSKYNEVFNDLVNKRADAVLVDEPMARAYSKQMGGMTPGTIRMHVEQYGFAVRKGDKALLNRLNEGLARIRASGEFETIRRKWFED